MSLSDFLLIGLFPSQDVSTLRAKFLHFHAIFGKNWSNNRLAPPLRGWCPPPLLENPGSATAIHQILLQLVLVTSHIIGRFGNH